MLIIVKAFQELAKGEQTAAALENHLTNLEARIEQLLAQANQDQQAIEQANGQQNTTDETGAESVTQDKKEEGRHT